MEYGRKLAGILNSTDRLEIRVENLRPGYKPMIDLLRAASVDCNSSHYPISQVIVNQFRVFCGKMESTSTIDHNKD